MTDLEFLKAVDSIVNDSSITEREAANAIILLTTEFLDKCEGNDSCVCGSGASHG